MANDTDSGTGCCGCLTLIGVVVIVVFCMKLLGCV